MKRFWLFLIAVSLLVCLPLAVQATEGDHRHCVCGGAAVGVGDHSQCEEVTWMPLSQALEAVGLSLDKADFGKLPDGHYYLDGDVIVAGTSAIGAIPDDLATQPSQVKHLSVCLNGHKVSVTRANARVFGYLHMQSSLDICDCSYNGKTFRGSVSGSDRAYGGIIYTSANSTLNIYGGNLIGTGITSGGALSIGCDDCGDLDGDGVYDTKKDPLLAEPSVLNLYNGRITGSTVTNQGGAIQLFHGANMNMYGGTVVGGNAKYGSAISNARGVVRIMGGQVSGGRAEEAGMLGIGGTCYITGGTFSGGKLAGQTELCMVRKADGSFVGVYTDFSEALTKAQNKNDRYITLLNNIISDAVVDGTVYIDLAGYSLQGITITGKLYGMDSATDGYVGSRCGVLTPASGAPERVHKTNASQVGAGKRYLGVENGGGWSFHRFYMSINKISLKADTLGVSVGYKAEFAGSSQLKSLLAQEDAYGYRLWVKEDNVITQAKSVGDFKGHDALTLRVDNFMTPLNSSDTNKTNSELPLNATVFVKLADGTVIESDPVTYSFRQMVELADPKFDSFTQEQQAALNKMSVNYGLAMVGWDVPHIHHATGSIWTSYTQAKFLRILKDVGNSTYYKLPAGNYVLSEDVDLSQKQKDGKDMGLRVYPGETVRICLNGHTLSCGDARLFRVYGQLDICDCQRGEHEGYMISHLDMAEGEEVYGAVFYAFYNSQVNLYGGNLQATGTVVDGGVCGVDHEGGEDNAHLPAAVFNMYGGTISGGTANRFGGLIDALDGAVVNIYDGKLYGGYAKSNGGLISLRNGKLRRGATLNMYGGELTGGTTENKGGAVCVSDNSVANLYGGTISKNTAVRGGGIRVGETSALKLAGTVVIENNTASDKDNNISLVNYKAGLNVDELMPGSRVYLNSDFYRVLGTNPQIAKSVIPDNTENTRYAVRNHFGRMALVAEDMNTLTYTSGKFQVGYGQVCINPRVIEGMPLSGYSTGATRRANAQDPADWDDLYAQAVAITDAEGETILIIILDLIRCKAHYMDELLEAVHAATNVPKGNIFVTASHNHSSPETNMSTDPAVEAYLNDLNLWVAQAAYKALADRAPATMDVGSFDVMATVNGKQKRLNFMRHYSYTDANGVLQYFGDNFGTATYNSTTKHLWEADPTMHLVRFVRDGKDILMSNWRIHPHRTGGSDKTKMSADVIGTLRYYMNQMLPDTHFVYVQGAAGDVNSTSRLSKVDHGLDYIQYGKTLAQVVVNNLGCLKATSTGEIRVDNYVYTAISDKPSEEEYQKAEEWKQMILDEEQSRLPEMMPMSDKAAMARELSKGTYDYASYYELANVISRYKRNDTYEMPLNAFAIGDDLGFFTAPAELWDTVSIEIEESSPFKTTICVGYSMDYHSYYPYYPGWSDVGAPYESYESECRHYVTPTTILDMIAYWKSALQRIHE